MKKEQITEQAAKELIKGKLSRYFGVAPAEARKEQLYKAVVMSVRDIMLEKRHAFHLKTKAAVRFLSSVIRNTTRAPSTRNTSAIRMQAFP